jgi:transcriptional regulator with XRE-family HTH domain
LLQREVAAQFGANEGSIWNWEANRTSPTLRFIPGIVQFLGYVPFPVPDALPETLTTTRRLLGVSRKRLAKLLARDR